MTLSIIEQHIFRLLLTVECAAEKVSQFIMLMKSKTNKLNKNFCYKEQKCVFEYCRKVKTTKGSL